MSVNKVANPRSSVLGYSYNLSSGRGVLNSVWGLLALGAILTGVFFAAGLALQVGVPALGSIMGRVPVVGDTLSQGSGGPQFRVGGN